MTIVVMKMPRSIIAPRSSRSSSGRRRSFILEPRSLVGKDRLRAEDGEAPTGHRPRRDEPRCLGELHLLDAVLDGLASLEEVAVPVEAGLDDVVACLAGDRAEHALDHRGRSGEEEVERAVAHEA